LKCLENAEFKQTKRPERGQKCWQHLELVIHGLNRCAVKCLEMSRKRGVQAARNAPDSLATSLPPDSLTTGHCSAATRHYHPLPPAGNWVRFSCSIPRLFVLSRNMQMINTTGKLALFWRFSITARSLPSNSLVTILSPHASRRHPPGQVVRGPSTPGYCPTPTAELAKS